MLPQPPRRLSALRPSSATHRAAPGTKVVTFLFRGLRGGVSNRLPKQPAFLTASVVCSDFAGSSLNQLTLFEPPSRGSLCPTGCAGPQVAIHGFIASTLVLGLST
jgi:hypothetical protein